MCVMIMIYFDGKIVYRNNPFGCMFSLSAAIGIYSSRVMVYMYDIFEHCIYMHTI